MIMVFVILRQLNLLKNEEFLLSYGIKYWLSAKQNISYDKLYDNDLKFKIFCLKNRSF